MKMPRPVKQESNSRWEEEEEMPWFWAEIFSKAMVMDYDKQEYPCNSWKALGGWSVQAVDMSKGTHAEAAVIQWGTWT